MVCPIGFLLFSRCSNRLDHLARSRSSIRKQAFVGVRPHRHTSAADGVPVGGIVRPGALAHTAVAPVELDTPFGVLEQSIAGHSHHDYRVHSPAGTDLVAGIHRVLHEELVADHTRPAGPAGSLHWLLRLLQLTKNIVKLVSRKHNYKLHHSRVLNTYRFRRRMDD
jgi:hypothetical protein